MLPTQLKRLLQSPDKIAEFESVNEDIITETEDDELTVDKTTESPDNITDSEEEEVAVTVTTESPDSIAEFESEDEDDTTVTEDDDLTVDQTTESPDNSMDNTKEFKDENIKDDKTVDSPDNTEPTDEDNVDEKTAVSLARDTGSCFPEKVNVRLRTTVSPNSIAEYILSVSKITYPLGSLGNNKETQLKLC